MAEQGMGVPGAPPPAGEGAPKARRGWGGGPVGRGLEAIFGVLFMPRVTLAALAEKPPLGLAAVVVGIGQILSALVSLVGSPLQVVFGPYLGPGALVLFLLALPATGYIIWPASAALVHLTGELLGGRGRAVAVMALFGLAQTPIFLLAPLGLALALAGVKLQWLVNLALVAWILVLEVMAVRYSHRVSVGKAVGAVFLPPVALAVAITLMIVGIVALAVPLMRELPFMLPG